MIDDRPAELDEYAVVDIEDAPYDPYEDDLFVGPPENVCDWSYSAGWINGKRVPSYTCPNPPRWRIMTTFSNAQKTDYKYCDNHGYIMHDSVRTWANTDHMTKPYTMVLDLDNDEAHCICEEGDICPSAERYRAEQYAAYLARPKVVSERSYYKDADKRTHHDKPSNVDVAAIMGEKRANEMEA